MAAARPSTEELLAHVAWVRRLARLLVADAEDAADVEQETWRQALERPPLRVDADALAGGGARSWLATVARNVARKLVRSRTTRERHERGVGSPAASAAASEVTARAELHRRVVESVLALDELYRAPLLLRFFDDLSAQEVAARLGLPVETARTRIKRGLAQLRSRLGGERGLERIAGLLFGGIVVSKVAKVGAAVVVAAAAVVGSYQLWIAPERARPELAGARATEGTPAVAEAPAAEPIPAAARVETERAPVDRGGEERPTPDPALAVVEGRVVDDAGRTVAGATVALDRASAREVGTRSRWLASVRSILGDDARPHSWRTTTSASDGSFRFEEVAADTRWSLGALHDPLGIGWSDVAGFTGAPPVARATIALQRGVVLHGTVKDEAGQPVEMASLWLRGTTAAPDADDNGLGGEFEDWANTSADGSYRSLPLPWRHVRAHAYVHAGRPDLAQLDEPWEELPAGVNEVRRDFTMPALTTLRGRILGTDGAPALLAKTLLPRLGDDARRTQTKQTIAAVAFAEDPRLHPEIVDRLGMNDPALFRLEGESLYGTLLAAEDRYEIPLRSTKLRFVAIVARDVLLGVAEIPQPPTAPDVVIDASLVPEQSLVHVLRLHFVDERDGSQLAGVRVHAQVTERTKSGQYAMSILNFGIPKFPPADRELELPRAPCTISMEREGFVSRSLALDASRPDAPTELTLPFAPASASIAVDVRNEAGGPLLGASVRVYRRRSTELEAIPAHDKATTDEKGACVCAQLPLGECVVVAESAGFAPAVRVVTLDTVADGEAAPSATLTLARGYAVTLRPRLADGTPVEYGLYAITTEDGLPLYDRFHPRSGADRLDGKKLKLTDGRYTVRCAAPGLADASATFVAAPGVEVVVEMRPLDG